MLGGQGLPCKTHSCNELHSGLRKTPFPLQLHQGL